MGYPISRRFQWDGFITQVMQKAVFQWRPESGSVAFVNVFHDLSRLGYDDELEDLLVPRPDSFTDEAGLEFGQIMAKRLALLDAEPALCAAYHSVANPLNSYGLPQSRVREFEGLRAIRLQRAVLQVWTSDFPWAAEGTVTVANGGDLAKQVGLFWRHQGALVPELPPTAAAPDPLDPAPQPPQIRRPHHPLPDSPVAPGPCWLTLTCAPNNLPVMTAATGRTGAILTATAAIPAAKCWRRNDGPTAAGTRCLTG